MDQLIGINCTFQSESAKTMLADGFVKSILYHNDNVIRPRKDHLNYQQGPLVQATDPYPADKFYTYNDKITKPVVADKKAPKPAETKEHKNKFITVGPAIKKWLATICSRLSYECDLVFSDLITVLQSGTANSGSLDAVMFGKNLNINLFKLVAKIVGNHDVLLKKHMNFTSLERDVSLKISERYEAHHPTRLGNLQIAGWLAKLIDDFFKVLGSYISSKNWHDRDATLVEKNFGWILWQLAENTEYDNDLGKFIHEMRLNLCDEEVVDTSNYISFDLSQMSEAAKQIMAAPVEQKKKGSRGKKAEPNKTVTTLNEVQTPQMTQFVQPQLTQIQTPQFAPPPQQQLTQPPQPQIQAPQFTQAQLTQFAPPQLTQFAPPQIQAPQFTQFAPPQIQASQFTQFAPPQIQAPQIGQFNMPSQSYFQSPQSQA
jgi:hypothetical protein